MRLLNRLISIIAMILVVAVSVGAGAAESVSLDELLRTVKSGRAKDAKENAARIAKFRAEKAQQTQMLAQIRSQRATEESRSKALEAEFEKNDGELVELEAALTERLGGLKELFGVLQQASGDARGQFENSITQVQFPERVAFLNELAQKMGQTNKLASLDEIERLWFELQREMTESGKVSRFTTKIIDTNGQEVDREVTRVGTFNLISQGNYLEFVPETGKVVQLARQPRDRYLSAVSAFEAADSGVAPLAVDPSRGQLLKLLVQAPSLWEQMDPRSDRYAGGLIGKITIALGILGLIIAAERLIMLTLSSLAIGTQARRIDKPGRNALGRVAKVYQDNPTADVETLELKLSEAIMRETPKFNRLLMFLKIIAVVAPLLGLLGTVTGMIITFQSITLFGTGDPKLMANGISQALTTTVLGLCVAIPIVLLHTLVASRAKRLTQVLEEQAAGMIATQAEGQRVTA